MKLKDDPEKLDEKFNEYRLKESQLQTKALSYWANFRKNASTPNTSLTSSQAVTETPAENPPNETPPSDAFKEGCLC